VVGGRASSAEVDESKVSACGMEKEQQEWNRYRLCPITRSSLFHSSHIQGSSYSDPKVPARYVQSRNCYIYIYIYNI